MVGRVQDGFPRVVLALPARGGGEVRVVFIVDTGFDGELAVPNTLLRRLDVVFDESRTIMLADGTLDMRPFYTTTTNALLDEDGEPRLVEVASLDAGNPLLGVRLLAEQLVTIEMTENGDVTVEAM